MSNTDTRNFGPFTTRVGTKVDGWQIESTKNGYQLLKNGANMMFSITFDKLYQFVKTHGTEGDVITINATMTLQTS